MHELLIDGQSISSGGCIDMKTLIRSLEEPGDYFLLTCSCGEPCAGLDPFHVQHEAGGIIYWHIPQPEPEREFYFSRQQAVASLIKGLRTLKKNEDPRWSQDRGALERLERLQSKLAAAATLLRHKPGN